MMSFALSSYPSPHIGSDYPSAEKLPPPPYTPPAPKQPLPALPLPPAPLAPSAAVIQQAVAQTQPLTQRVATQLQSGSSQDATLADFNAHFKPDLLDWDRFSKACDDINRTHGNSIFGKLKIDAAREECMYTLDTLPSIKILQEKLAKALTKNPFSGQTGYSFDKAMRITKHLPINDAHILNTIYNGLMSHNNESHKSNSKDFVNSFLRFSTYDKGTGTQEERDQLRALLLSNFTIYDPEHDKRKRCTLPVLFLARKIVSILDMRRSPREGEESYETQKTSMRQVLEEGRAYCSEYIRHIESGQGKDERPRIDNYMINTLETDPRYQNLRREGMTNLGGIFSSQTVNELRAQRFVAEKALEILK